MPPPPEIPPAIPNYRLLRCIGQGTYGEVWLALDVFHRWTAVKIVRRSSEGGTRNHDQEFRGLKRYVAVAGLDRSLMPITNVGEDQGGAFFHYAMELADDAVTGLPLPTVEPENLAEAVRLAARYRPLTLKEMLQSGRLPPEECVRHGIDLAESLECLHQNGLVHRDVKPSNVILVSGRAKLADIGLVTNPDATMVSVAGTPDFVPLYGAGRASGDIFALGKVLYLMANGRPLSDFPELFEGQATLPEAERHELAELAAVYDRACDPDLAQRYTSAKAVREDLERLRRDESVLELRRQAAALSRRESQYRRLRRGLIAVAALTVLVSVGFVAFSWRTEMKHRAALGELENRRLARMNKRVHGWSVDDWQAIRRGTEVRRDIEMLRQAAATLSGLDAQPLSRWSRLQATSAAFSPAGDLVLSGYGTAHASLITRGTNRAELPVTGEGKVAWARDGEPLIFQVEPGKALVLEARTGRVRREFPLADGESGYVSHAPVTALSLDGTWAAAVLTKSETRRLVIWDVETGALLGETNLTATVLTFAPDGSRLGLGHENGSASVFRLGPFGLESTLPSAFGPNPVQALAFGKDTLVPQAGLSAEPRWLLAVGDRATGIVIWELADQRTKSFCRGSNWEVQSLAFHPDGVTLASAGRLGVHFWDVATGQSLLWGNGNGSITRALVFNSDGSWLAAGSIGESADADVNVWELKPDRGIRQLSGLAAPIRKVTFSPDGRRLAALSDEWRLGVWEIPSGRLLRIFELAAAVYADSAACAFDADHRRLAFAAGTSARIFDLDTGRTEAIWNLPFGKRHALQFTPDGRLFLSRVEPEPGSELGSEPYWRWSLYELPPGQAARPLHRQAGFKDATINLVLTAGASRLVVLGKDRQSRSNHLAAIEVVSGREQWRRETGGSKGWEILRVDPAGSRCAAIFGPLRLRSDQSEIREMTVVNLSDGQGIATFNDCSALSPVGTDYAVADAYGIRILDWQRRDREAFSDALLLAVDGTIGTDTISFSPDGLRLAFGGPESGVFVANLAEVRRRLAELQAPEKDAHGP